MKSDQIKKSKHLIIGALPPPVGGTTVLFDQLIRELFELDNLDIIVIDTSVKSKEKFSKFKVFLEVISQTLRNVSSVNSVSFHGSVNGALQFFPVLRSICYFWNKPVILRTFGGDFDERYLALNSFRKAIFRIFVLSADMLLFETIKSVDYFRGISNTKVFWYANSRPYHKNIQNISISCKPHSPLRVVFIGHVKPNKGVRELIAAALQCQGDIKIDIYGPISEGIREEELNTNKTHYAGILEPKNIIPVLAEYDVLALPTYFNGEGYPGVILEAFTQAMPVITTSWRCIPEIVDESCGIMVKPGSIEQITHAIDKLANNTSLYCRLSNGAALKAEKFSSSAWTQKYYELIQEVANSQNNIKYA